MIVSEKTHMHIKHFYIENEKFQVTLECVWFCVLFKKVPIWKKIPGFHNSINSLLLLGTQLSSFSIYAPSNLQPPYHAELFINLVSDLEN